MKSIPFKNFQNLANQLPLAQLKMIKGGGDKSGVSTADADDKSR